VVSGVSGPDLNSGYTIFDKMLTFSELWFHLKESKWCSGMFTLKGGFWILVSGCS
jgi:hypothetical protein